MTTAVITLIGGPTALIEVDGFRLLTDPTFDEPGEYTLPHATLRKNAKPAIAASQSGAVDAFWSGSMAWRRCSGGSNQGSCCSSQELRRHAANSISP